MLDEGVSPRKAIREIEASWLAEFSDYEDDEDSQADLSLLYISLAALQMRHKELTRRIKKKAIKYLESGADLHLWEEGEEESYQERKKVLAEFKNKLSRTKAKFF